MDVRIGIPERSMIESQIEKINNHFTGYKGTITAFSGGIDSALVLYLSRKFLGKEKAIGVISNSESLKNKDYQLARDFASEHDIQLRTIYTNELSDPNYNANPHNRCYFCKMHLYEELVKMSEEYPDFIITNGTNADDYGDYRPGIKAADEHRIRSPLAELGIRKEGIRQLARYFNLTIWDKPASPCLSSRIPYGMAVTEKKLAQIEKAEDILNRYGFIDVRVRHYDDICKIEVPAAQIEKLVDQSNTILPQIQSLGFRKCVIDQEGLVSGKLNRSLHNV
jgi:uncharacterized protein